MARTKRKNERRYRVGKYTADYAPVSQAELNAPDAELEALLARSKPVSQGGAAKQPAESLCPSTTTQRTGTT